MQKFSPITLGESLTKINNGRFILTETKHQPDLSLTKHSHKYANLVCVLQGSYTENVGQKSFECISKSLLLKPAGEFHFDQYHKGGAHCLIIEILPQMSELFQKLPAILQEVRYIKSFETISITNRIYREICIADSASEMAIEGLTLELLVHITRQGKGKIKSETPYWIVEARDFIHAHFNEPISLIDVAESVNIDSSHLTRVFRRKYNCSIGDYIRQLRLNFAAEQLVKTEKPLAEVSALAGFYDQSHFSRTFKNYMGITPGKYRADKS